MIREPSVLDYVKSRLKFWDKRGWIEIPPPDKVLIISDVPQEEKEQDYLKVGDDISIRTTTTPQHHIGFPWRAAVAVDFAIFGQAMWEPQTRNLELGVAFYLIAAGLAIWAFLKKEWEVASLPSPQANPDPMTIRLLPFLAGIVLGILAFLDFGGNLFTWHNILLWLGAIGSITYAFLNRQDNPKPKDKKLFRINWKVILWGSLILGMVFIIGFFRSYQLNSVPSEPISDHAEKILDIYDITQGQPHIFFPRNTGREAIQMYLTLAVSWVFQTGLSFLSLKIGTVLCGIFTLPYIYLLGKEYGGKTIGLMAVFIAGIAYWPNIISRFGLRFPLYPLFAAPTLYYLIRGLRTRKRNDFIISGIFLGFGLHGYSPFRIIPIIVVVAIGLYLVHAQSKNYRKQALVGLVLLAFVSFIIFLPLARYWIDNPASFSYRAFSRLGAADASINGSPFMVFLTNTWNAIRMFNWDDGSIWVISVTHRPALDVISGALFLLGVILIILRYIQKRNWIDLFILVSIPLLALPSILSLAFPDENPAINRAGAAMIPVFIIVATSLDGLVNGIRVGINKKVGIFLAMGAGLLLLSISAIQNFNLVFDQYASQYSMASWNSSEMGEQILNFKNIYGTTDTVWVVAYPNRVDTRLPGIWAGVPNRDFGIWPDQMADTVSLQGPKLFILWPDDLPALTTLEDLYPVYELKTIHSKVPGHDFLSYFITGNP